MATALDIISTALRQVSAIANGTEPTAEEAQDGLESLNDMVHAWSAKGVHIGYSTLRLTDDFPIDDRHIGTVKALLSVCVAPEYGMTVPEEIQKRAFSGWQHLKSEYSSLEPMRLDMGISRMPSQRFYW
jgi:hypothetical protein